MDTREVKCRLCGAMWRSSIEWTMSNGEWQHDCINRGIRASNMEAQRLERDRLHRELMDSECPSWASLLRGDVP